MGSSKKVQAPTARNYFQEMQDALGAQTAMMSQVIDAERAFIPQFQNLQREKLLGQVDTMGSVYEKAIPMAGRLSEMQAQSMAPAMGAAASASRSAYRSGLSPTANSLIDTLEQQAKQELSLGGSLTSEEQMVGQQAARAASQARGLGMGNQAIANEVLANYGLSQQREMMRRSFASSVYGMSENSAARGYQMYGSPLMSMVGATSAGSLASLGMKTSDAIGPSGMFNPESSYNASMITANRKEKMDAEMFNIQQNNAMKMGTLNAMMKFGGAMVGGFGGGVAGLGAASGATGAAGAPRSLGEISSFWDSAEVSSF